MDTNKNRAGQQLSFFPEGKEPHFISRPINELSVAQKIHAEVVNSLAQELTDAGFATFNLGFSETRLDLAIARAVVVEVKSKPHWADFYCCLGQLIVYSQGVGKECPCSWWKCCR
jgi:hypothetical protein